MTKTTPPIILFSSFLFSILVVTYVQQPANAILLPNELVPGSVVDTEKPFTPQFEKTLKDLKAKLPSEEYNRHLDSINGDIFNVIGLCTERSSQLYAHDTCNGLVSMAFLFCKGEMMTRELTMTCPDGARWFAGYLNDVGITDP